MSRLAIVTTHPIQYNAPLFRLLASRPGLDVKVFYTLGKNYSTLRDKGFGKPIVWDIPLLDGYEYEFLENAAREPSTKKHWGVVNPSILERLEEFNPTAILVYGWNFQSHLKVLRYFNNKKPLYFRGDSVLLNNRGGLKSILKRLLLRWVYSHITKAFYVGNANKQYFMHYGLDENNLVFAPHAIDNDRFGNDNNYKADAAQIRERLQIPEHHIVFAYIGKFEQVKNITLLIRAFKQLRLTEIELLLVGDGELKGSLELEANGYKNIHFMPFQNQAIIPSVYRAANVFVLPSTSETWGLAVNEAMSCGLPVIVSDKVGCAIDLVHSGVNGFIFRSGDVVSLLEKLSLCATMPEQELKAMGDASRELIGHWSFERVCEAIVDELKKVRN